MQGSELFAETKYSSPGTEILSGSYNIDNLDSIVSGCFYLKKKIPLECA